MERPGAAEDEIRMEVRRTLDTLAPQGGYCALVPIINDKVRNIVVNEVEKYGKSFYNK